MALRHPQAPQGHADALSRQLQRVVMSPTGSRFLNWRFESPPRARGLQPHPVYHVGRDAILAGRMLTDDMQPHTWRTLMQLEGDTVYAVELGAQPGDGAEHPLVSLTKGGLGAATRRGLEAATRLEWAGRDDVEVRLLKVPALHFMALWLRGVRGDALLPVEDHPSGLAAHQPYEPEEVLLRLGDYARAQVRAEAQDVDGEMN